MKFSQLNIIYNYAPIALIPRLFQIRMKSLKEAFGDFVLHTHIDRELITALIYPNLFIFIVCDSEIRSDRGAKRDKAIILS